MQQEGYRGEVFGEGDVDDIDHDARAVPPHPRVLTRLGHHGCDAGGTCMVPQQSEKKINMTQFI
jgi:hypothetical protein